MLLWKNKSLRPLKLLTASIDLVPEKIMGVFEMPYLETISLRDNSKLSVDRLDGKFYQVHL